MLSPSRTRSSTRLHLRAGAALLALFSAAPAVPADAPATPPLPADPVLAELIAESLAARPELRQAEATARAERERVPQAGALPDPVLSLGLENEGFDGITVGEMEGSFYQVMLSQGIPWPGKRGLRTDVARLGARRAEAGVDRARLSTEADVRRSYVDLLLARDRLELLRRLEAIWQKSSGVARARYEAGEGAQSDVLRSQLELNRIRQRRWALEAQERASVQTLNRLRGRPLDAAIATTSTVRDLGVPPLPAPEADLEDAARRSPELAQARLSVERAGAQSALARRERFPDLSVDLGIMPRGSFEPMWQAGISVGLPVWSHRKQNRAVAESAARAEADSRAAEAIEEILRLRVAERRTALASLLDTIRLYREGLLVQSQATADSTLAQYRVGKVTFASVLEANAGYIADEESFLTAIADAQRIAIAGGEVSLDPVGVALGGGAMGTAPVPGAGAAGGAGMAAPGAASAPAAAAPAGGGGMTSGM
jgi:outer membrane protein TolC